MAPEIPLGGQRPASYVFDALVEQHANAPAEAATRDRRDRAA
jgi:hypothetical protein